MYMYHYPDIWYDYATWHATSGSIDAAIKVFQRALKALPGLYCFLSLAMLNFLMYMNEYYILCSRHS